jgi:hypothetical protein
LVTPRGNPIRRNPDFTKLWAGQTISLLGSAITMLALPSVAILTLGAKPFQVGLLQAAQFLAFPILALPAGVWVDRWQRRIVMIVADIGRALALGSIPLAWALHALTLAQLYAVALIVGVLTVFFDVAYQAYLPALVERDDLVDGNAKLAISQSASELAGSGLAGILIQALGAPLSVLADAVSFVASVLGLAAIRKRETKSASPTEPRAFLRELKDGSSVVFANPYLRSIAACTATANLASGMLAAVFLIFAYHQLKLAPALVGGVLAFGNLGVAGAFLAAPIAQRFGLGRTLSHTTLLSGIGMLVTVAAAFWLPVVMLLASQLMMSFALPIYNVNQVSLRQAITPDALQGRMNATMRAVVWGTLPIGSVLGGALGNVIGIVPTIAVAGGVAVLSVLWIRFSQVYRLASTAELM